MSEGTPTNHHRKLADLIVVTTGDEELVRDCLAGKETAWVALIEKYKRLIYSLPIKYRLPPEDAADIFQETCLELLSSLPRLRQARAVRQWLIQVTVHKCLRVKERRAQLRNDPNELADPRPGSDVAMFEVAREQAVRDAISRLSPRCQQLVRLLFFETPPRPYRQIAKTLKVANGSIGFIRGRCLDRLRANLRREDLK
jgi:RNA polymerase sigma factor (sigma-70 family)